MCEPKPNNCRIEFLCHNILDDCYQQKRKDITDSCVYHDGLNEDGSSIMCSNIIAQVNVAILFLKKTLGDENLKNYIKKELDL